MAATNPQTLFAIGKCFECYGPLTAVQILRLAILSQTLNSLNPMAATDPQSLLAYAKCFSCFSNASMADMMELALLDQIYQNITGTGGGGIGEVFSGHYAGGAPTQVPTAPAAIAYDLDAPNNEWLWNGVAWF
ncbi:MAG: hypothetical protein AUG89_11580 [Acidobacteria bacterium 13_1_20CM_4_56_7]|nr:MAG: hypothetical protein AUG89_11580 [Acidobacteria bacterium 13_1_20CM_4_56_7]